jgi:hypothetical protein
VTRVAFLVALAAAGCALAGEPGPAPTDEASCVRRGGKWGPVGLVPAPTCNLPTTDGGKPCRDRKDCESACVAELTAEEQQKLPVQKTGKCAARQRTPGCLAMVEDGWVRTVLCVD